MADDIGFCAQLRCAGLASLIGLCLLGVNHLISSKAAAVLVGLLFLALAWPPRREVESVGFSHVVPVQAGQAAKSAAEEGWGRPDLGRPDLRKDRDVLRAPRRVVPLQAEHAPDQMGALKAQLRELLQQIEAAKGQEERTRRRCEAHRSEAEQAQAQASSLSAQLAQLKQKVEADAESMRERERQAQKRADEARAKAEQEAARASKFADQLETMRSERDDFRRRFEEAHAKEHKAVTRCEAAQAAADEAAAHSTRLQGQLQDANEAAEEARARAECARQQEQQAVRMCREARLEAEQAAVRASVLALQVDELRERGREGVTASRSETSRRGTESPLAQAPAQAQGQGQGQGQSPGQAKWAAKLAAQLTGLQEEHDKVSKQRDALRKDMESGRDELASQKNALRKARAELQQERQRVQQLEAELQQGQRGGRARMRRQGSMPTLEGPGLAFGLGHCMTDTAAIEAVGGILQRSVRNLPEEKRQNFKRQLLLCFHPDRNPATELATRVTQILTGSG